MGGAALTFPPGWGAGRIFLKPTAHQIDVVIAR
jgi:hypothetical protein